jgi:16S rRNA (guanine1207-N2)-methyltransferase
VTNNQYFEASPSVASQPRSIHVQVRDLDFDLTTDRGVFSYDKLDPGTRVLLELAPLPPASGELLDLGCGYGPVAIALAHRAPDAHVWAIDVNERARSLTTENAQRLERSTITVAAPEEVDGNVRFAAIYSNPPVHVGKAALHDVLLGWLPRLDAGAHAYLVVHRHLGSDSLAAWLSEQGYTVRRIGSRKGYRVLDVTGVGSGTEARS